MIPINRKLSHVVIALALLGMLAGCHKRKADQPVIESATSASSFHLEGTSTDRVNVSAPAVELENGVLHITGHVHRRGSEPVSGRVDIDIIDSNGTRLAWLAAVVAPNPLPSDNSEAGYAVHYGWIPPAGSTLRARFVDTKEASVEDASRRTGY